MNETSNSCPSRAFSAKPPSAPVVVPVYVPATTTLAPTTGCPSASMTFPVTSIVLCAKAPDTEAASSRTTDTNALNKRRPTPQLSGRFFFIAILGLCFYCGLRASAGKCGTESAEASPGKVFTKTKLKRSEKSRGKAATLRLLHPRKRLFHCLSITSQRTMK